MVIRRFEPDDFEAVLEMHLAAFEEIGLTEDAVREVLADPSYQHHVAEMGGIVVGSSLFSQKGSAIYWNWLAVVPLFRKRGAAKELLAYLKAYATQVEAKSITGDTRNRYKNALMLYLKNDFSIVGTFQHTDGELMIRVRYEP